MNISAAFIRRPIGTSLMAMALLMAGALAFNFLPVAPLPQVEFPVISVGASLPGASPETMASAVATPLERQFGRIAGINQMTSTSQLGSTGIVLQFDLNRNIDAAGRDVQAAINAARSQLPANLPGNPNYRKVNPADAPILILALTSDIITLPKMYDAADSILSQKLAQIEGVGQVFVGGGAKPAVRAEVNPTLLNKLGVGLDTVRTALTSANANIPKGELAGPINAWTVDANDQIFLADQYRSLIVSYSNGAPVRLGDVATVSDSVEDIRNIGLSGGKPAVLIIVFRQPGANIIATVDRVRGALPQLRSSISPAIDVSVVLDRTTTVRASVHDIEATLLISVILVILVVFAFLRTFRATLIPSVAVPLSLVGTFGVMYLLGYSLDNLSLMALAISTGFVVDDAIVVLENITRHIEEGVAPVPAAFLGAREIGFTVLIDEYVAGGRIHPDSDDGRHRRPPVPGICGHIKRGHRGVAAGISHGYADDVREVSALGGQREAWPHLPLQRKVLRHYPQSLQPFFESCPTPPASDPADHDRDRRPERVSLHHRSQGLLSAAGHRANSGFGTGRAGYFVRRHEGKDDPVRHH